MKLVIQKWPITILALILSMELAAQTKIVTGTVQESGTSSPLTGVNILAKLAGNGTQSDADGKFSIEVNTDEVLVFSYIGFNNQEIKVAEMAADAVITLEPNSQLLDEVVVIGYGTQSRRNVTSAISKLDNNILANAPRANVGSSLQGTLPGLQVVNLTGQPGAVPYILLRGGASINNPGAPLVVIDGVIRPFNDISPDDIASVELLKDAASTAIYGARANNGVILITTKQGKAGTSQISYKVNIGTNQRREGYNFVNARDYIYYTRLGHVNSQRTLAQANSSRGFGLLTDAANLASFDIRSFNSGNANLLSQGWDTLSDPYGGTIIFKDHSGEVEDIVFRNTRTQDHYLSANGGNDRGRYFASLNYYKEDGVIVGSDYKRYTGAFNGSYNLNKRLEVSTGVNFSTSGQLGVNGSEVNNLYRNLAIWPTFNPWLDEAKTKPNPGNGINDGNPLYWLDKLARSNEVNRITANASIKYDLLPGLYVKFSGNGYYTDIQNESFQKATQTYLNLFANPPSFSNTARTSSFAFSKSFQRTLNGILNYTTSFGNHNITAMVGAEHFNVNNTSLQIVGTNAPTDDIPTANASTLFAAGSNFTSKSQSRIISGFGRLNYNFKERYLLTLVFRQDGVSNLAEANRWGFFPGMSAGWMLDQEPFFQNSFLSKYVSMLKPRFSYGLNGNVTGIGNYEVQGVYGSQGNYNGLGGFLNTGVVNNDLVWEKSKTLDIGADIGILNNKVTFLVDYFNRETSDLLTGLSLPGYTGFTSVTTNLGSYQNKGIELGMNASIIKSATGFTWDVGFNATFIKNKIVQLPFNGNENNRQGGLQIYDPVQGKVVWVGGLQEGKSLGDIYAYKQESIFKDDADIKAKAGNRYDAVARISGPERNNTGANKITPGDVNWRDVDRNDTIDSRDQVFIGNIYPKWTGGITTSLGYKGLSLFGRLEYATGHTIYNDLVPRILGNYQGTFNYIDWQKRAWSPTNTDTDIPKVYFADQVTAPNGKQNYTRANNAGSVLNGNNSRFYEKGDYLAIREITLSYDIPKSLLGHTKVLSNARIYVNANNLLYFTKFSGGTPEPALSLGGVYAGTYPTPKSFVFGLQASF